MIDANSLGIGKWFEDGELNDEHLREVDVWHMFLERTDFIPNKILEGVATSADYADELYYREVARQELDKLNGGTGEVVNAVPLDVLLSTLLGVE